MSTKTRVRYSSGGSLPEIRDRYSRPVAPKPISTPPKIRTPRVETRTRMNYLVTVETTTMGYPYKVALWQENCVNEMDAAVKTGVAIAHLAGATPDKVTFLAVEQRPDAPDSVSGE